MHTWFPGSALNLTALRYFTKLQKYFLLCGQKVAISKAIKELWEYAKNQHFDEENPK